MAITYIFNFSDTTKTDFSVYPYTANGPVSPSDPTKIPQAVTARTTLKLYGKGMQEYGEGIEQNLIYMLENFANSTRPVNSIEGQIWYSTGLASPSIQELFIRNSDIDDTAGGPGWDGIMLSTGSSQMSGDLNMGANRIENLANPNSNDDAISLGYADGRYINAAGDTMDTGADLTVNGGNLIISGTGSPSNGYILMNGGTITGLPLTATINTEATSKNYVDAHINNTSNPHNTSMSALSDVNVSGSPALSNLQVLTWESSTSTWIPQDLTAIGVNVNWGAILGTLSDQSDLQNALNLKADLSVVTTHSSDATIHFTEATISHNNIADTGSIAHSQIDTHIADGSIHFTQAAIDHTSILNIGTNAHSDIDTHIADTSIHLGSTTITRTFEITSVSTGSPPLPYMVKPHIINDNKLSITINGQKQYNHTNGFQQIKYDVNAVSNFTGLDSSLEYGFNISIGGGVPSTVTILAGSSINTHVNLAATITALMQAGSPQLVMADFDILNTVTEQFTAYTSGSSSSVTITDPGGSPSVFLFASDPSPSVITSAIFRSGTVGSPAIIPDDIILAGNVSALFPAGKSFTIRGSNDTTYGNYDGVYKVHDNGPVVSTRSPFTTTVPIAWVGNSATNISLFPSYMGGSPAPSPIAYGNVHFTPIGGFDQLVATNGLEGDYMETDSAGSVLTPGSTTDYVIFNVNIPSLAKIETILVG